MIKLAVPTSGNIVDDHFGHCDAYTLFTINANKKIEQTEMLPSPQGCGCKSNIGAILKEKGVSVMLAGNMGTRALNVLKNHDIEVYCGCSGGVLQLVESFLKGKIGETVSVHKKSKKMCGLQKIKNVTIARVLFSKQTEELKTIHFLYKAFI
ncbi:putative Fe-Mo cluster-binding NifX family protein [Flavobacterium sp. 1]|uniref:NifB/NifX family molybdenum-iron cluster-binding protein n=1 Tax=Flavobacterium sp. 1 TaxID=2035200 RepID=UPI000CBEFE91|nr:NifB/NifX family molybdenum-iron cluster-binding protein [Flavobacterium sp. 1]PJJ08113.1 putative Fe-Mo cluster-binding NifX family protein [Flavobacterium sp. 1]